MNKQTAFVGDIHGNLVALSSLIHQIDSTGDINELVFLGDYINRGPQSRDVIQYLMGLAEQRRATFLRGNHEEQFIRALETDDQMPKFLKMGGADSIRSYVGTPVPPTVGLALREKTPASHIQFLNGLSERYESNSLVAQHRPFESPQPKYTVVGHRNVGEKPRIDQRSAQIDTGCTGAGGRLTAFLWPSKHHMQVNYDGAPLMNDQTLDN